MQHPLHDRAALAAALSPTIEAFGDDLVVLLSIPPSPDDWNRFEDWLWRVESLRRTLGPSGMVLALVYRPTDAKRYASIGRYLHEEA